MGHCITEKNLTNGLITACMLSDGEAGVKWSVYSRDTNFLYDRSCDPTLPVRTPVLRVSSDCRTVRPTDGRDGKIKEK